MNVFLAAREGELERLKALVEQNAALVHATDTLGRTPLLYAAYNGHVEVARYLLDHGAMINHSDYDGRTALQRACSKSHAVVPLLLLQRGADVTAADDFGETPLISAASSGRDVTLRMLLEHGGSDVDAATQDRWTACHHACRRGDADLLKQLLEAGADPTLRDYQARTALELATHHGHHNCIRIIQEWDRAYLLRRVRCLRNASSTPPSTKPQQDS